MMSEPSIKYVVMTFRSWRTLVGMDGRHTTMNAPSSGFLEVFDTEAEAMEARPGDKIIKMVVQ